MKSFFSKIGRKRFKLISVITLFMGDLLIISYMWGLFSNRQLFEKALKIGFPSKKEYFDPEFKFQLFQANLSTLKVLLALYLVFHLIHYVCFMMNKRFAGIYLKIMVWVAGPGLVMIGFTYLNDGNMLQRSLFLFGIIYILLGIGFIYFPQKKAHKKLA
jgi:hypothetical protein